MVLCDSHFHLADLYSQDNLSLEEKAGLFCSQISSVTDNFYGITCCHSKEEYSTIRELSPLINNPQLALETKELQSNSLENLFEEKFSRDLSPFINNSQLALETKELQSNSLENLFEEKFSRDLSPLSKITIYKSFGLFPQNPSIENAEYLESLLKTKQINFIGECGFDFFTPEFKALENKQLEAFSICVDLAEKYQVPLIIHNRKALDKIFLFKNQLKKVKAILFHSFSFTSNEGLSILKNDINAYFSFGNSLFNNNKKAVSCVENLPFNKILAETDAPFQPKLGNKVTNVNEIYDVYKKICEIKNLPFEEINYKLNENFINFVNS